MRTKNLRKLLFNLGIACLIPTMLGAGRAAAQTSAAPPGQPGWQEKNQKLAGVKPQLEQNELINLGKRVQEAVGAAPLAKSSGESASSLHATLARAKQSSRPIDVARAMQQARRQSGPQPEIWRHESNGTPIFMAGPELRQMAPSLSKAASAEERALSFIVANREVFLLDDPRQELEAVESFTDEFGMRHLKFAQSYKDIPIWGHDLVMHLDAAGELYAINARYSPTPRTLNLEAAPISAEQAIRLAENNLAARAAIKSMSDWEKQFLEYSGPIAAKYIWVDEETQAPHLIWLVEIRPNLRDWWHYFIDAQTGAVRRFYNATNSDGPATAVAGDLNGASRTINVYLAGGRYYMIDATRPMWKSSQPNLPNDPRGAVWTLDARNSSFNNLAVTQITSTNNQWPDQIAVSAHYHAGLIYDYYRATHGRNSIDNLGSTIISVIHLGEPNGQRLDNAFWNGQFMAYGDGRLFKPYAGALDVAAHEMTHGVIQRTVNLKYEFQSGALNESIADVFGVMVDRDDWLHGEDITPTSVIPSGASRNMQDPHNGGRRFGDPGWQPAHTSEFVKLDIAQDNGGVHVNSGITNRACYLIGNAIGKSKTERIYYRVLEARYLNSLSQFIDMRLAAIRAATDLFGSTSAEAAAVRSAFDQVGIAGSSGTQPPQDRPPVQGDEWIALVNAASTDNSLILARPVIRASSDVVTLTRTQVYTKSSSPITVSDDGKVLLFVDAKNYIRVIGVDGRNERVISSDGIWSSIALSPSGTKLAATTKYVDSTIYVFDLVNPSSSKGIHLYSPTTGQGVAANITMFADALDWDLSSRYVLYDAFNRIPQSGGGAIAYWDVNVLDVVSNIVIPLFPSLPPGFSIGNPAFAQTNDIVLAFDFYDEVNNANEIWAVNLFTGQAGMIERTGSLAGHARYSPDDRRLVFQKAESGTMTLRQIPIAANKIQPSGASQFYGSDGQLPVWFAIGRRTGVEEKTGPAPAAYELYQNYPNPFNPQTEIKFTLAQREHVVLRVYDLQGREVARLVDGALPPGAHRAVFSAANLPSGIYVYRLQAGTFSSARRMVVLK
jgi:Zn-dependent metalloprotease